MIKDKSKRLGYAGDAEEILSHPFFSGLDFEKLVGKDLEAPFKPEIEGNGLDFKYFNAKSTA